MFGTDKPTEIFYSTVGRLAMTLSNVGRIISHYIKGHGPFCQEEARFHFLDLSAKTNHVLYEQVG